MDIEQPPVMDIEQPPVVNEEPSAALPPSRRQVLRGGAALGGAALGGAALGGAALGGAALADGPQARAAIRGASAGGAPEPPPGARGYDFDLDWKFALVNADGITDPTGAFAGAYLPGFDDSGWLALDLPHDWSIGLLPTDDGTTISGNGFFQGGLGWYRKTFTLLSSMSGKRIWIEFDGVYMNSFVYLNGELLGNHPYAYTGFGYDLTGMAHTDGTTPNVIAVQATNQIPSSRWYSGSGIYRNVRLIVTDPVHIARHGIFVTTPDLAASIGDGYGTAQVRATVQNDSTVPASATVTVAITDRAGAVVARGAAGVDVPAGQAATATITARVDNPMLWSVADPALYALEARLSTDGGSIDRMTVAFGFRYFVFDPVGGFSLNGQHVKLRGADLHATQGPLGAVILPDAVARQVALMKSMGVNAVRTAHNPPAPELTAACEREGMLMMVEAFDCWHTGKLPFDYHLYFDQWSDSDITEMVLAHRNSPAVVLWSIGNETPDTGTSRGPGIAARLVADVKAVDTTRPVVMGSDRYRSVPKAGSPPDLIVRELDGLGVNYNTATSMDGLHATYPDTFFFCSETSSETSARGSYQRPDLLNTGENYTPGGRGTSSYDNNLASWTMSGEYELKKDRDRLFWQGGFLWSGQDYIGEPTPYDVFPVKSSFFGAIDTAGLPKDAYYLYQSQWTAEPMVHIVPMDWTSWSAGEPVSVWVYSNLAAVELFLNGRSLGVRRFDEKVTAFGAPYLETTEPTGDDDNYPSGSYTSPNGSTGKLHLSWSVPFEPGVLSAVAYAAGGTGPAVGTGPAGGTGPAAAWDTVTTAGRAHAIVLACDARALTADGQSVAFVTASVADRRGVVVPSAENVISFAVSGAPGTGVLAATDNGRQESAAGYQSPDIAAFGGKAVALVRAGRRPGTIRLTATSPGLEAAAIELASVPPPGWAPAIGTAAGTVAAVPVNGRQPAGPVTEGAGLVAGASYSGAPDTIPAMMLDGDPSTGWSNFYVKAATANLHAVSSSNASDWVSLALPAPRRLRGLSAAFVTGGALSLPASIAVTYWDGHRLVAVSDLTVSWAAPGQPSTLSFDPVTTTLVRVTMTSPSPGTAQGFLRIAELGIIT